MRKRILACDAARNAVCERLLAAEDTGGPPIVVKCIAEVDHGLCETHA